MDFMCDGLKTRLEKPMGGPKREVERGNCRDSLGIHS